MVRGGEPFFLDNARDDVQCRNFCGLGVTAVELRLLSYLWLPETFIFTSLSDMAVWGSPRRFMYMACVVDAFAVEEGWIGGEIWPLQLLLLPLTLRAAPSNRHAAKQDGKKKTQRNKSKTFRASLASTTTVELLTRSRRTQRTAVIYNDSSRIRDSLLMVLPS